jgi:hypothetical protein
VLYTYFLSWLALVAMGTGLLAIACKDGFPETSCWIWALTPALNGIDFYDCRRPTGSGSLFRNGQQNRMRAKRNNPTSTAASSGCAFVGKSDCATCARHKALFVFVERGIRKTNTHDLNNAVPIARWHTVHRGVLSNRQSVSGLPLSEQVVRLLALCWFFLTNNRNG